MRAILFDKDGTLIDYWKTWLPINSEVALRVAKGDEALARDLLRAGGQDPETGRLTPGSALAAGGISDIAAAFATHPAIRHTPDLESLIDDVFARGGAAHSVLIDGARETLLALQARGIVLGLATNDSAAGLRSSLAAHDVLPLFAFTAGCDSGWGAKPGPGMVRAFSKETGIPPAEIAVVGDAVHDLAMGRAAGAGLNIAVLSGTSGLEDFEGLADVVLGSVVDLLTLPPFASR